MISALVRRELRAGLGSHAWLPLAFFLLVATIFSFAIGPDARLLSRVGGGVLWVAALLAALLPIDRLVAPDVEDGTLDQLHLRGASEELVAAAKILGHWLTFGPLLLLAALPASALLGVDGPGLGRIILSLAIGTPALAALGVTTASLVLGLRGSLAGLVALPLAVPLLIFGVGVAGLEGSAALKFEIGLSLVLLAGAPFVSGAAIRAART